MTDPDLDAHVPLDVVCELTHGAAQDLADELGIDLLHLKGAALDPVLSWPTRTFSDTDVLVRPGDVDPWMAALADRGWQVETSFDAGSPFAHATTLTHPVWGYLDVHRWWPGFDLPPEAAFDELWEQHQIRPLASVPCAVPQLADQALIQCLHLARSGQADLASHPAVRACRTAEGGGLRAQVERRVVALHAEVGYAVIDGTLERFAGHPDQPLWSAIAHNEGRVAEWRARVRREPTRLGAARMTLRALRVNTEHVRVLRGRPLTRLDVVREFGLRLRRAVEELRR